MGVVCVIETGVLAFVDANFAAFIADGDAAVVPAGIVYCC